LELAFRTIPEGLLPQKGRHRQPTTTALSELFGELTSTGGSLVLGKISAHLIGPTKRKLPTAGALIHTQLAFDQIFQCGVFAD
jgi:hypothetical protein